MIFAIKSRTIRICFCVEFNAFHVSGHIRAMSAYNIEFDNGFIVLSH